MLRVTIVTTVVIMAIIVVMVVTVAIVVRILITEAFRLEVLDCRSGLGSFRASDFSTS